MQPKRETLCECIKKPTEVLATQAALTGSFCSLFNRHHFARKPLASSYLFVVFIYLFVFLLTSTLWNTGPLFNYSCFFQVIEITDYRAQLYDYLKNRMTAIAPNLTVLVGELVGARLIAHAG